MLELASIWKPDVQQQNFRSLLDAMSRPGQVKPIFYQENNANSTAAVLAALLDGTVSLADPEGLLRGQDWSLLQAVNADPAQADYILCTGHNIPRMEPKLGTLTSPEHSATLVLKVDSLTRGTLKLQLIGPGVDGHLICMISGLDTQWLSRRDEWVCAFPLGVDFLMVDRLGVMALPRTTLVEVL